MKKTLKTRIRKALFAFFREEIMEAVTPIPEVQRNEVYVEKEMLVTKIERSIVMTEQDYRRDAIPFEVQYEKKLDALREKLFEDFLQCVQIDNTSVFDERLWRNRRLDVYVYVAVPKK